jgi:hypothetical protein
MREIAHRRRNRQNGREMPRAISNPAAAATEIPNNAMAMTSWRARSSEAT